MLYVDLHTVGPTPGQINIKLPRLTHCQDGQEHSAYGTGPGEICAKGSRPQRAGRHLRLTGCSAEAPTPPIGPQHKGAFHDFLKALAREAARADDERDR